GERGELPANVSVSCGILVAHSFAGPKRPPTGTEVMKLTHTALPTPEEIARHMGLRDLRLGKHFLRNGGGEQTGCCSVCTLWYAEIVPSCHPRIALAVATAPGEPFRDSCAPDWVKAVMATPEAAHVITIEADPMRAVLNGIDLFCGDRSPAALEGITYTITFQ